MNKALSGLLIVLGGTLGVVAGAHATPASADGAALCVDCTTNAQFAAAAKQAAGTRFNGTKRYLVVNPDTLLSKWVMVTNTPAGQVPLSVPASSPMTYGVPVAVKSNPFANIYIAGQTPIGVESAGALTSTRVSDLTTAQIAGVKTLFNVEKDVHVITLDPVDFPSYEGSSTAMLAKTNYNALVAATNHEWPVSIFTRALDDVLKDVFDVYIGHSEKVCDIYANGDSVCTAPVPGNDTALNQVGSAHNLKSQGLPIIGNNVAGGGSGMSVSPGSTPGEYEYMGDGIVWEDCYWSNGIFEGCFKEND